MRAACPHRAVATLTYNYAESTAVVGPLAHEKEPHSWDLCASHALRISPPRGWHMVRHPDLEIDSDPDLTALLDAVVDTSQGGAGTASDPEWLRRLKSRQRLGDEQKTTGRRAHLRVVHPDE